MDLGDTEQNRGNLKHYVNQFSYECCYNSKFYYLFFFFPELGEKLLHS